jgi:Bacterial regulatory protein, Fis family
VKRQAKTSDRAQARAFGALVRSRDPKALDHVLATLGRNGGNVTHAAAELGVGLRTLLDWLDQVPALRRPARRVTLRRGQHAKQQSAKRDRAPR